MHTCFIIKLNKINDTSNKLIQANPGDEFEKNISPDGQTITFRKK